MAGPEPRRHAFQGDAWKRPLKVVRHWPPFSYLVTHSIRGVLRVGGWRSEWAIRHIHRVGGVTASLPNGRVLRLWSQGDDWISNQVFWRGWAGHEPETTRLFFRLAQQASVTVDVGAYVGYYTLLAAHANPDGRVIALEPLPAIYERLLGHVALNKLKGVECVRAAAGAEEGTASFYHHQDGLPTSSSLSHAFMGDGEEVVATTVPVVTIDGVLRRCGVDRLDLLKMDTESTEPAVLAGALEAVKRDRPWILCEVLKSRGSERQLEEILGSLGYRFYLLTPDGLQAKSSVEGHPDWLNYLFAPQERVVRPGLWELIQGGG